jgi:hypothetical protein
MSDRNFHRRQNHINSHALKQYRPGYDYELFCGIRLHDDHGVQSTPQQSVVSVFCQSQSGDNESGGGGGRQSM